MKAHPAAKIFPPLEGAEFDGLVQDIQANGLVFPIVLLDGQILDGRNRYRACQRLGIEPRTVSWKPKNGQRVTEYVISANLHRRHLTTSQRAAIAVEVDRLQQALLRRARRSA